jgi:predicted DNA-binding transcriptional regulator YafY
VGRSRPAKPARSSVKLQRWMDLLAALLARRYPATLEDLAAEVPGYVRTDTDAATWRRMFERDKAELRRLGVPLETVTVEDGETVAYRLTSHDFYLPYLCESRAARGLSKPKRIDRYGYRGLTPLVFEPEELRFVSMAAERLRALNTASLSAAAESGLRKLHFDLPLGVLHPELEHVEHILGPRASTKAHVLDALIDAVTGRKRVQIEYYSIGADATAVREVEPYGLFLISGNWYLAARDMHKRAVRTFRASRIGRVRPNRRRPGARDYAIPDGFVLREYAQSREAWEIGDNEAIGVVVEFRGEGGAIAAAARLGTSLPGEPRRRQFQVRRLDTFARWLLSFGGEALPIAPDEARTTFGHLARKALAVHTRPVPDARKVMRKAAHGPHSEVASAADLARPQPNHQASAQLLRLLSALPILGAEESVDLKTVAARTGIPTTTLIQDLRAVGEREDTPAGFIEAVQVYLEHHRVRVITPHFLRPMRLTVTELVSLELGLAMLRRESSPEDQVWIDRARVRLHGALARAAAQDADQMQRKRPSGLEAAGLGVSTDRDRIHLSLLRRARLERKKLRVRYLAKRAATEPRTLHVYSIVYASGMWYVVAYCEDRKAVRRFRLDRIDSAEILPVSYSVPKGFSLDDELRGNQVLSHAPVDEVMRVWYSPRIARWIAERERSEQDVDGSVTLEHPMLDIDWAVRYVLQYGAEAEVVSPSRVREAICRQLEHAIASVTDSEKPMMTSPRSGS